jgi:hypothetical protein
VPHAERIATRVKASEVYEVEVVPLRGRRLLWDMAKQLVLAYPSPGPSPGAPLTVQVVERGTRRVVYRDRARHNAESAGPMQELLEQDLDEMSPEEFLQTWG